MADTRQRGAAREYNDYGSISPENITDDQRRILIERERRANYKAAQRWQFITSKKRYIFGFAAVAIALLFVILMSSIFTLMGSVYTQTDMPVGQGFGASVGIAMIDPNAFTILDETMTAITEGCTPPDGDPVLTAVGPGSEAATYASWQAVKASVEASPLNPEGCTFYGLDSAEFNTDSNVGPLQMCWGYAKVALQIFLVEYDGVIPPDITSQLNYAYDRTYPLTMYWNRIPNGKSVVVGRVLDILNDITLNPTNTSFVADQLAREFCNEFFSLDDLNRYDSTTQPWLGFPFPGTQQRVGNNSITGSAVGVLGEIDLIAASSVKSIYAIGDVIDRAPAVRLLAESVFGFLDLEEFDDEVVSIELDRVYNETFDSANNIVSTRVPVVILGRYAEDIGVWNNARTSNSGLLYFVTDNDPTGILARTTMADLILNNAETRGTMSQLDFTSFLTYELELGTTYQREMDVAEIIVSIIRPDAVIEFNETVSLMESFAIKNTIVNNTDLGGRTVVEEARRELQVSGNQVSLGFALTPPSLQLQTTVITEENPTFGSRPIPQDFSWRSSRPQCLPPVVNQGRCNNCWAIATAATIGSRFCTQGRTQSYAPVSRQHVTSCAGSSFTNGCEPGYPETGFSFMYGIGAVDSQCFPFAQGPSTRFEAPCIDECADSGAVISDRFYANRRTFRWLRGKAAIQRDLAENGPLAIGMDWPANGLRFFAQNPTGVYNDAKSPGIGGHLVLLVGYCTTCFPPYWEMQNSYGTSFADNGFFKVRMDLWGDTNRITPERYAYRANPDRTETFVPAEVKVPAQDVRAEDSDVFIVDAQDNTVPNVAPLPPSSGVANSPLPWVFFVACLCSLFFSYS